MSDWIDLSTMMTPEFFKQKNIKRGSVLIFDNAGVKQELKIVRLNRTKRTCWVEPVHLYTEDEINAMDRSDAEDIIRNGK
jgi:hypothetical protein